MITARMLASFKLGSTVLIGVSPISSSLVGLLIAVSFAAGLNVYATVATLGLLAHASLLELPTGLHLLTNWWIIGASLALFCVEFFADKIPAFDLLWNALHTFVRIPVAALIAYGATAQLSPETQMLATIAGGLIALAAHGGKTAARVAVTPSPEPISNFALSASEDTFAVFITWLATQHPYAASGIVIVFLVLMLVFIRWIVRRISQTIRSIFAYLTVD
jgi:hypothetical protein